MPLQAPNLDDRTFEDLLLEAQLRIPRYTPEWTDFNDSDPGMTLVQLFAWLSEMMLYRLNQVPERNYIKFLQMLGLERAPAQPARVHVTFAPDGMQETTPVPARAQVGGPTGPDGQPVIFETERAIDLVAYPLSDVQVLDAGDFQIATPANLRTDQSFAPFGYQPQPGNALYLGFQPLANADLTLPVAFPASMRLRVFLPALQPTGARPSYDGTPKFRMPQVNLVWEYRSAGDPTRWRPLAALDDETASFTREGYLEFEGPADALATTEGKLVGKGNERYWLRCRLASGSFPLDQIPGIAFVRTNTVDAINLVTVIEEDLGPTDGFQRAFTLAHKPIEPSSLQLIFQPLTGAATSCRKVDDFFASTRDDLDFMLSPATGVITFGDGQRGRIPEPGGTLTAQSYRYGGGGAGNIDAGTLTKPATLINVKTVNERRAVGGKDEQSVEDLKQRAPLYLRSRGRVVTAEDFRLAAESVPGVIKAAVQPGRLPEYPDVTVPGAITVVIVPDVAPASLVPPPMPSEDLLALTFATLDALRLVTTELRVTGPRYRAVEVDVDVRLAANVSEAQTKRLVELAIRDFLSPVPIRQSAGRAFGQRLYRSNLFGLILGVKNDQDVNPVLAVSRLTLRVDGTEIDDVESFGDFAADQLPSCGTVNVFVPSGGAS